jgi:predicted nucleic acid-binding protein
MGYLLDANVVIGLLNDATSKLAQRARREKPADIAISSIVAHELFYGAFKSRRATQIEANSIIPTCPSERRPRHLHYPIWSGGA